jgi:Tol biopolymer transport system component
MTVQPGTRLGFYEVTAPLGEGGMGEVYRARDTKLGRDVALKVLPDSFAHDPERLARFEREAHLLAALNHPNIAHIHGFEDSTGTPALVMELVEGPTLADRIARGPIPLDEALPIAKQITEALEAAHEQGIIHRDLKPANIKVRADGTVKVLDFGLAKAFDPTASSNAGATMSPTLSIHTTQAGIILGTAAYMAPEQARGKPIDKRADIWAFGCVLYEMLTGRRAFDGGDISTTLAAVLKTDPEWSALPPDAPPSLRRLLSQCLQKEPRERLRDIGDARITIDRMLTGVGEESASPAGHLDQVTRMRRRVTLAAVAVCSVAVGAIAWSLVVGSRHPAPVRVERFELVTPRSEPFTASPRGPNVVMSPDGSQIAYHVVNAKGSTQLAIRKFSQLDQTLLPGTDGALYPFFSPDGAQIAFVNGRRQLMKLALVGGAPVAVCDLESEFLGGSWGVDDVMVFAQQGSGLFRVSAAGGKPERLATPDATKGEHDYASPEMLPGGKAVLATIISAEGSPFQTRIAARVLATGETRTLVEGGSTGHYLSTGHLVYRAGRAGTLAAVPFDIGNLRTRGTGVALQTVMAKGTLAQSLVASYSVGSDGSLVVASGEFRGSRRLIWIDRAGKRLASLTDQPIEYPRHPRLSPDGGRLAVTIGPPNEGQIWIYDLKAARQPLKLTFKGLNFDPAWTPDGTRVTFSSADHRAKYLVSLPADGRTSEVERLTTSLNWQLFPVWSPDGQWLLFTETSPRTRGDLWVLPASGDRTPRAWLQTEFNEGAPAFSPNGRWVAYASDQTGQPEIWVRPFPGPGAPIRVSPRGGLEPVWSRDGRELFYQEGAKLMAAEVSAQEPELRLRPPRALFEGGFVLNTLDTGRTYDVAPDGRFLMIEPNEVTPVSLVLVKNWVEELKRLVPTK